LVHCSAPQKNGIERPEQGRIAEWLEQALHGTTLSEHSCTEGFISNGSDEDDRDVLPAMRQFSLQVESSHSRHDNIDYQTSGLEHAIGHEELLRR
jgi:hypothetical protein